MRSYTTALCAAIAGALLAGCGANMAPASSGGSAGPMSLRYVPMSVYGDAAPSRAVSVLHQLAFPDKAKKLPSTGTYVTQFDSSAIFGYLADNKANKKPICSVSGVASVNDVAVDLKGNLIDPDGGSSYVIVHKGPTMCGKELGLIQDSAGQAADASSPDAVTGKIVVSNLAGPTSTAGTLSVCTLKGGCTVTLSNKTIYHSGGTAMAPNGDCWTDAKTSASGGAALIYFKGCAGGGKVATGFKPTYYGGIDLDNKGNLVIIDDMAEMVYIYSGCNPACKTVGGPFALKGESFFGKLSADNSTYTAVARANAEVDVYSYSTKGLKFQYSYNADLVASEVPDGIAVNPRSKG
ncbi:MAG TPA: hypothetical protein VGX91_06175 [Candidatus Cybelea sp.]|jgi:hypothetical protein|nr:hypothetical protein [Candidatus Cybelea sp.]